MGLHDKAVPGNEAVPGGRLRTGGGEDIREGSQVGEPNGVSDSQEDRHNRGVFLYSDRGSTA